MQHISHHSDLRILGLAPMADLGVLQAMPTVPIHNAVMRMEGIADNNTSTWMLHMMCAPLEPEDVMF